MDNSGCGGGEVTDASSNRYVKMMEKGCHVHEVDKELLVRPVGMGVVSESIPIVVGGSSFTIQFYPDGSDPDSHRCRTTSLFIKNQGPKPAQIVYHIQLLDQRDDLHSVDGYFGFSSIQDRKRYHEFHFLQPGTRFGFNHFKHRLSLAYSFNLNKDLRIRATIGVLLVLDPPPPRPSSSSFDRCILFQVGDEGRLHYALESVISTRCPSLLLDYPQSNNIVVISDVETDVFKAVLRFLHTRKLHEQDRKAIANYSQDLFALKMLAAADKFNLTDLRRQCEAFISYGDSQVLGYYFDLGPNVMELWENISMLPKKIMEFVPQKMKTA